MSSCQTTSLVLIFFIQFTSNIRADSYFDRECKPIDLVFVVDSSGSINDHHVGNYDLVKTFMKNICQQLRVGENDTHVSLVSFSKEAFVIFNLDKGTDMMHINRSIDRMIYLRGSTNMAGGIELARTDVFGKDGDRDGVMDIMFIITDGMATVRINETIEQALMAKEENIHIVTMGITENIDSAQLLQMSTDNNYLMIDSFEELNTELQLQAIYNATCFEPVRRILGNTLREERTWVIEKTQHYDDYVRGRTIWDKKGNTLREERTWVIEKTQHYDDYVRGRTIWDKKEPVGICEFANVVFVIDGSGSVNDEDDKTFAESIQYSLDVIAAMAVGSTGVFASVVTFNEEAHVELELSQRYLMRTVIDSISNVAYKGGRTNLAAGIEVAREHINEHDEKRNGEVAYNFIVVVSDGHTTKHSKKVLPAADKAKEDGIYMISSSVTGNANKELLRRISSNYTVFDATEEDAVETTLESIVEVTCAPRAPTCEQLDIVFVLDSSGSINDYEDDNFERMKTFVKNVSALRELGPHHTQIAAVSFSDYARYEFFLREGRSLDRVEEHIDNIRYVGGLSVPTKGLLMARKQMLGRLVNGDRKLAKNIIVFVSDAQITGDDVDDEDDPNIMEQVYLAAQEGAYILTVSVGAFANKEYLRYVASNGQVSNVLEPEWFNEALNHIVESQCDFGGDCGYFDIVFIVDHSESIVPLTEDEEDNYLDTVKSYMTNITSHFNIDPYFGTQVAAVSFSDSARIEFSLREATSNAKVADMTGDMKQLEHGRTNIHSAITLTQTELLLPAMGNRPLIPTVIVIFSDGQFNADLDDELHEQFESLMEENTVIAIGLSRSANRENLRYISHHYMARYKYDSEVEFLQEVHEKICPSG